jgi:hypothetical protein
MLEDCYRIGCRRKLKSVDIKIQKNLLLKKRLRKQIAMKTSMLADTIEAGREVVEVGSGRLGDLASGSGQPAIPAIEKAVGIPITSFPNPYPSKSNVRFDVVCIPAQGNTFPS